jgi:type II secretory pathway pseudopilin PulG
MRARRIRIIEIATVCAVLGILVSLAIPTLMRMQARSRVASDVTDQGGAETQSARDLLENYARIYNGRFQQKHLPGEKPILVVEPSGTLPIYCRRDGKVHLIPFVDSSLESVGATVVVTDENRRGGPACDGILAVYNVEPGTE